MFSLSDLWYYNTSAYSNPLGFNISDYDDLKGTLSVKVWEVHWMFVLLI